MLKMTFAMQFIRIFFETSILFFHYFDLKFKIGYSIFLSILLSPILVALKNFLELMFSIVIPDLVAIAVVLALLMLNTWIGAWKHFKCKTFNPKKLFTKFLEKLGICTAGMILFQISNFIASDSTFMQDVFSISSMSVMYLWLGIDTAKLLYVISNGKFPPPIIMERFQINNEILKENADEK